MQRIVLSVTPAGTTGGASGASTAGILYNGELHAVYVDRIATTAGTVRRIQTNEAPSVTLFTVSGTAAGWYFPRNAIVTSAAAAITGTSAPFPITGQLALAVASGAPLAHTAYIYIKEQ